MSIVQIVIEADEPDPDAHLALQLDTSDAVSMSDAVHEVSHVLLRV